MKQELGDIANIALNGHPQNDRKSLNLLSKSLSTLFDEIYRATHELGENIQATTNNLPRSKL